MMDAPQLPDIPDVHEVPEGERERAAWRITSESEAVWAVRKIADARRRRDEVEAIAGKLVARLTAEIEQVQEWVREQCAEPDQSAKFFAHHVERFVLGRRDASGGKVKSLSTPYGVVKTVAGRQSWQIDDEEAAVRYLSANRPDLLHRQETVSIPKSALKDGLEVGVDGCVFDPQGGEQVPGVRVVTGEATVKIDLQRQGKETPW